MVTKMHGVTSLRIIAYDGESKHPNIKDNENHKSGKLANHLV